MRTVPCDLCGSLQTITVHVGRDSSANSETRSFHVVECRGCGLFYVNPRPEGSELASYYPDNYYDTIASDVAATRPKRETARAIHRDIRRVLLQTAYGYPRAAGEVPPGWVSRVGARIEWWRLRVGGREASTIPFVGDGLLLDVGCGTGRDLEWFQRAGWRVSGVEMSPYAASRARARLGCEILEGHFDEVAIEPRQFDAIRLSHVLEHLPSPRRSLERIHRLLRPGGLLWLEVPNAASAERRLFGRYWFQWDLPRHLYHFTPQTLTRLLCETGFRPRKVKCDGRTVFFAESLAAVLTARFGLRPSAGRRVARLCRPLVYALGALNAGGILTVHAVRD